MKESANPLVERTRATVLALVGLIFVLACVPANAQAPRGGGGGDAVARVQAMLQQERARVAELTATNRRLEEDLKKSEARIAALESQVKTARRGEAVLKSRLNRTESTVQARSAELESQRGQFKTLLDKSREIANSLRDTEQRAATLTRDLAERDGQLAECTAKNSQLISINEEMVAFLRGEGGTLDGLLLREPFTGIKRVRRENMADDFAYRAEENAVTEALPDGQ